MDWFYHRDVRGRTERLDAAPTRVLEATAHWHATTRHRASVGRLASCGIVGGTFTHDATRVEITELRHGQELTLEGRAMRHCVATYGTRVKAGSSAIFSLRVNGRRRLTIEVAPTSRRIVQVRGFANRSPDDRERAVIRRWASAASLECHRW